MWLTLTISSSSSGVAQCHGPSHREWSGIWPALAIPMLVTSNYMMQMHNQQMHDSVVLNLNNIARVLHLPSELEEYWTVITENSQCITTNTKYTQYFAFFFRPSIKISSPSLKLRLSMKMTQPIMTWIREIYYTISNFCSSTENYLLLYLLLLPLSGNVFQPGCF